MTHSFLKTPDFPRQWLGFGSMTSELPQLVSCSELSPATYGKSCGVIILHARSLLYGRSLPNHSAQKAASTILCQSPCAKSSACVNTKTQLSWTGRPNAG